MTTSRKARGLAAVGALALLALAAPELASGHSGSASVSCAGASFSFSNFEAGSNTIHYVVTVDQTTAAQGDFVLNESGGKAGSLQVPLSVSGTHTVTANAFWGPAGTVGGVATGVRGDVEVGCGAGLAVVGARGCGGASPGAE